MSRATAASRTLHVPGRRTIASQKSAPRRLSGKQDKGEFKARQERQRGHSPTRRLQVDLGRAQAFDAICPRKHHLNPDREPDLRSNSAWVDRRSMAKRSRVVKLPRIQRIESVEAQPASGGIQAGHSSGNVGS